MKRTVLFFSCIAALAMGTPSSDAFPTYSQDRDATNCRLCHGDFRADNYISNSDRKDWGNLHNLHRFTMFDEDTDVSKCDPCHRIRVRLPGTNRLRWMSRPVRGRGQRQHIDGIWRRVAATPHEFRCNDLHELSRRC
jgi:hypothetical protein